MTFIVNLLDNLFLDEPQRVRLKCGSQGAHWFYDMQRESTRQLGLWARLCQRQKRCKHQWFYLAVCLFVKAFLCSEFSERCCQCMRHIENSLFCGKLRSQFFNFFVIII